MSELKAYIAPTAGGTSLADYYLKSEADKQVGELKDRITPKQSDKTLQERLNEVCEKHGVSTLQDLDWAFCESEKRHTKDCIEAVKEISHQKYKRCLAMEKWCHAECDIYNLTPRTEKVEFYRRWRKRWLELAEQFKEAK